MNKYNPLTSARRLSETKTYADLAGNRKRRGIKSLRDNKVRKQKDRLDAALPSILEGYCSKSPQPRKVAEAEAKEFLQIIEDSASYQFGYNHSIAYCLLGYLCAYFRYYHPLEFITSFLNNAANDADIRNGTQYAEKIGIKVTMPKWGLSRGDYEFDREKRVIAKGLASVKYMGPAVAEELYDLSKTKTYTSFMELLKDLNDKTSLDSRQLDILIKLDFFTDFGNQRELFRMTEVFTGLFKRGEAKQIKKSAVEGTMFDEIVKRHSVGTTKTGGEAKSYTLIDVMAILKEIEAAVKAAHLEDLSLVLKVKNVQDITGCISFTSGRPEDRPKLYVLDLKPLCRKSDGKQFGFSCITKSLGSGKESRFTLPNYAFKRTPIKKGDVILCKHYERDGQYFRLLDYDILI